MFNNISPTLKSKIIVSVGILMIIVFFLGVAEITSTEGDLGERTAEEMNILTTQDPRSMGIDAVSAKTLVLEKNQIALEKENEKLKADLNELKALAAANSRFESEISSLELSNEKLKEELKNVFKNKGDDLKEYLEKLTSQDGSSEEEKERWEGSKKENASPDGNISDESDKKVRRYPSKVDGGDFSYLNNDAKSSNSIEQPDFSYSGSYTRELDKRQKGLISVIESEVDEVSDEAGDLIEEKKQIYLPQGSILTGVLITGMDAPTSDAAQQTPYPVLVRIKKEAILPNFRTLQEVDECFALMGGYGDLSSERVMFRGEAISCIRKDGSVIEEKLSGYAVGEDAKAGLKGRVVTRNSKVLLNSMLSGLASGMASAFNVTPVPVIASSSDGTQQYQDVFDSSAVQGGLAKGASSAMDKLSDYYLSISERILPTIELSSGRVINIVLTKGNNL